MRLVIECSANVIRFPDQNTLRTRVKQIRNPQKEISGGFFILLLREQFFSNYNLNELNGLQQCCYFQNQS